MPRDTNIDKNQLKVKNKYKIIWLLLGCVIILGVTILGIKYIQYVKYLPLCQVINDLSYGSQYTVVQERQIIQEDGTTEEEANLWKGIITPEYLLEYTDKTTDKLPAVMTILTKDKYYINDGLIEIEDGTISRIKGMWYESEIVYNLAIPQLKEFIKAKNRLEVTTQANEQVYHLQELNPEVLEKMYGYSYMQNMDVMQLDIYCKVLDKKLESIIYDLTLKYDTYTEHNIKTLSHFEPIPTPIKLEDYGITQTTRGVQNTKEVETITAPEMFGDVPYGATAAGIITDTGKVLIGTQLSQDFIDYIQENAVKITNDPVQNADQIYMSTITYPSGANMTVYYSEQNHYLLGYEYDGEFYGDYFKSGLDIKHLNKLRIASGFTYVSEYSKSNIEYCYCGKIGGIEYIISLGCKDNKIKHIAIKPQVLYTTELQVLQQIHTGEGTD